MLVLVAVFMMTGLVVLTASLVGLVKPIPKLALDSRKPVLVGVAIGVAIITFAIQYDPAPREQGDLLASLDLRVAELEDRLKLVERTPRPRTSPEEAFLSTAVFECNEAIDWRLEGRGLKHAWTALGRERFSEITDLKEEDFCYLPGYGRQAVRRLKGNAIRVFEEGQTEGISNWCYSCTVNAETGMLVPTLSGTWDRVMHAWGVLMSPPSGLTHGVRCEGKRHE